MLSFLKKTLTGTMSAIKGLDVQHGKPMREITSPKATILPITMASILFFTWGLTYGILDVMNYHVRAAMNLQRQQSAQMALGYYMAYLLGAPLAGSLINACGYRLCMATGMAVVGLGAQFISLGAAGCSFPGIVMGNFVVGVGVSMLERSANAYAVNCGPRRQAPLRILIAQSVAGIGTVLAPLIANTFILSEDSNDVLPALDLAHPGKCLAPAAITGAATCDGLGSVISFYRILGALIFGIALVLAGVYFRTFLVPEVSVAASPQTTCGWKVWKHPLVSRKYSRMWWGVLANFVNLGCQVTFAQFFMEHMKINACTSDKWAANWMSVAQVLFVVGRFAAAGLVFFPRVCKPRFVLLAFIAGAVACSAAGVAVTSQAAIGLAIMVMFFEAPSFPMIFESATAGFGEWTPTCETITIISISGGGVLPVLFGLLAEVVGISKAWSLEAACFLFVLSYPLATCLVPSYRKVLDETEGAEEKSDVQSSSSQDVELAERN